MKSRSYDFGIFSHGIFEEGGVGACVIGQSCVDNLITGEGLCSANGGCWLSGDGPPYDTSIASFCAFYDQDPDDPYKGTCVQGCDDVTYCFVPIAAEPYYCDKCADGSDPILVAPTAAGQWAARRDVEAPGSSCCRTAFPDDVECTIGLYHLGTPRRPCTRGSRSRSIRFGGTRSLKMRNSRLWHRRRTTIFVPICMDSS